MGPLLSNDTLRPLTVASYFDSQPRYPTVAVFFTHTPQSLSFISFIMSPFLIVTNPTTPFVFSFVTIGETDLEGAGVIPRHPAPIPLASHVSHVTLIT